MRWWTTTNLTSSGGGTHWSLSSHSSKKSFVTETHCKSPSGHSALQQILLCNEFHHWQPWKTAGHCGGRELHWRNRENRTSRYKLLGGKQVTQCFSHVGGFFQLKYKNPRFPLCIVGMQTTVKYKMRSSWKSIPQHSSSQAFSDVSPSQTYSTLDPVSPHLSTSDKQSEAGRTHIKEGVPEQGCVAAPEWSILWLDGEV